MKLVLGGTADGADRQQAISKQNRKDARREAADARERSKGLRKAAQAAESELAKLQARKTELERAMFDPACAAPADAKMSMSELMKLHASTISRIESAEARWLKASEALEQEEVA